MTSIPSSRKTTRSNLVKTASKEDDDKPVANAKATFIKPITVPDPIDITGDDGSPTKTKKSALSRDENVMAPDPPKTGLINHRSIYVVYSFNSPHPKPITVPTNNVKMDIFASYPLYNTYMDMDFEKVDPKNLPPAGSILSDFWVWKVLDDGISDFKGWNADFAKRGLRANRVPVGRPAVTLCHTTNTWHYMVVYGNVELHGDDGRRLGWSHILNRKPEKKPMISLRRPAIQEHANHVFTVVNLLGTDLTHREKSPAPFTWPGTYAGGSGQFSPATSPAPTDASTDILMSTDDSAPKRKVASFEASSKRSKTMTDKKLKYLVMSSSEGEQQEVEGHVSLAKFNELYVNAEGFQKLSYDLLRGLKTDIVSKTTINRTIEDLYERSRIQHKALTKDMTGLTDVKVVLSEEDE